MPIRSILFFSLLLIASCTHSQPSTNLFDSYDVTYYDINVDIAPAQRQIKGYNAIHFKMLKATSKIKLNLYANMTIKSIKCDGKDLAYKREKTAILIDFPKKLHVGDQKAVTISYHGSPQQNTGRNNGINWKKDKKGRDWIGMTCIESGAQVWYPNKEDLSDEPDSVSINITAPKALTCVSNGVLKSVNTLKRDPQKRIWKYVTKHRINNYNVTFYLGHFLENKIPYTDIKGKKHNISTYCIDYNNHLVPKYFQHLPKIIDFYESIYGEYPFWDEKMCFIEGGYRGMEHQTCINVEDIGSPNNYPVPLNNLIAHELSHEWWGNLITAKDLSDTWLHEGFATYTEALLVQKYEGQEAYNKYIRQFKARSSATPLVGRRGVRFNSFKSNNIYFKGGLVLHELRQKIANDKVFFKILKTFLQKYRFQTVMTEDFINTVNKVSGKNYTAFLKGKLFK